MKKFARLVLVAVMLAAMLSVFATPAFADVVQVTPSGGTSGNIQWEIYGETLTISAVPGTDGKMPDYKNYDYAPWYYFKGQYQSEEICEIIVKEGVTRIGKYAFCYFDKVSNLEFPKSCKEIAYEAFYNCEGLNELSLYGDVGEDAFVYCYNLHKLTVGEGCTSIGREAFSECYELKTVSLPSSLQKVECEAFEYDTKLKEITYYGTKESLSSIVVNDDNEPVFEAINGQNNRTVIYKPRGTYSYIDINGNTATLDGTQEKYLFLNEDTTELKGGWYVVDSQLDFGDARLHTTGNTNILLLNGSGITTSGGIGVSGTLNIYSQTSDEKSMGYITVTGAPAGNPGIGANKDDKAENKVNICGGKIISYAGTFASSIGAGENAVCSVTIAGGIVDANSDFYVSNAVGIGGGADANCNVTITGGTVNAKGGLECAGIGDSGSDRGNCTVTITGGTVNAKGGKNGAGIGSGNSGNCTVTITGGTVNAEGGTNGAGIGSGYFGNCTVILSGGKISSLGGVATANGERLAAIGSGYYGNSTVTDTRNTGSVLSEGNIWIIIAVAVVVVVGVVVLVIVKKKKKKPALASGENTDEE